MRIRPLIIDEQAKAEIKRLIDYAEANIVSLIELHRIKYGGAPQAGDNPQRVCMLKMGYRCVFSIDEQPSGIYRDLSVSVSGDGEAPSIPAMCMIMQEFGFKTKPGVQHATSIDQFEPRIIGATQPLGTMPNGKVKVAVQVAQIR